MTAHPDTTPRPDWSVLAIAVLLVAAAALIAWDAYNIRSFAAYARVGPRTVPYLIAAGLVVLAAGTAIAGWRGTFPAREDDRIEPLVWIIGGLAAQMLLLKTAGFSIATGLMFAATARAFGQKPLWRSIVVGIVLSFFVWIVFAKLLQLSLPAGPLERLLP